MSSDLRAEFVEINTTPVLRLAGEMRLNMSMVEQALNRLAAGRPRVVVLDLSDLTFISSLGMGLLNTFRRGLHSHGGVTRIAAASPAVGNALRLCNLDKLFEMHDTLAGALNDVIPLNHAASG